MDQNGPRTKLVQIPNVKVQLRSSPVFAFRVKNKQTNKQTNNNNNSWKIVLKFFVSFLTSGSPLALAGEKQGLAGNHTGVDQELRLPRGVVAVFTVFHSRKCFIQDGCLIRANRENKPTTILQRIHEKAQHPAKEGRLL